MKPENKSGLIRSKSVDIINSIDLEEGGCINYDMALIICTTCYSSKCGVTHRNVEGRQPELTHFLIT